tara:strand:- start:40 stop:222 length:183 start_codon:yes stop_codon:yes gene_type:complete
VQFVVSLGVQIEFTIHGANLIERSPWILPAIDRFHRFDISDTELPWTDADEVAVVLLMQL